jgi:hypothetical protein
LPEVVDVVALRLDELPDDELPLGECRGLRVFAAQRRRLLAVHRDVGRRQGDARRWQLPGRRRGARRRRRHRRRRRRRRRRRHRRHRHRRCRRHRRRRCRRRDSRHRTTRFHRSPGLSPNHVSTAVAFPILRVLFLQAMHLHFRDCYELRNVASSLNLELMHDVLSASFLLSFLLFIVTANFRHFNDFAFPTKFSKVFR